jgi:primary-amine oxidase
LRIGGSENLRICEWRRVATRHVHLAIRSKIWAMTLVAVLTLLVLAGVRLGQISAKGSGQCSATFSIDETLPNGARWTMCWEDRFNEGIVLYDITFTPPGGPQRLILAQANLAQLHVPYDDSSRRLHDLTDFGLGGFHLDNLEPEECPGGQLRSNGGKSVLCQLVVYRGPAHKYYNSQLQGISYRCTACLLWGRTTTLCAGTFRQRQH